jgi:hypothetical protein
MRRAGRNLGPLFVCFAVACAMMAPYAGDRLRESTASDLSVHCSGIIEAYNALAEGQFPARVAPSHNGGHGGTDFGGVRYPLFQFYGQFPHSAGGLLCLVFGVDAFTAWRLVQLAALTLGAFYAYRCGVAATRRPRASLVAGVAFMTAPYMWTDLHARFAYPELISFNLVPVVTFYALRAFASRRRPWAAVLLGAAAWSLLAMSHNVTFLYASAFLGLYFASHLSFDRRFLFRITRVGLAYALGIVLTLWFHVPQFQTVALVNIRIQGEHPRPVGAELLTPLDVLLSPTLKPPPVSPTTRLGFQVGWPCLAGAALALAGLFRRRPGLLGRAPIARLLVFFAAAFFLAWSPPPVAGFDVWRVLPRAFAYVQSSYRILIFVTLFAALLLPHALGALRRGRDLPAWAALLVLGAVAWASVSYVPRHERLPADALAKLVEHPILDGLRDYMLAPAVVAQTSRSHPDVNWAEPIHGVVPYEGKLEGGWRSVVPVPPGSPDKLVLAGEVPAGSPGPVALRVVLDGTELAMLKLEPGEFRRELPIGATPSARVVPVEFAAAGGAVFIRELRFGVSAADRGPDFIPAERAGRDTRKGARTAYAADLPRPSLVQLPVLYYPGLLRVRVDGRESGYENVGRFVAVDLPAGRHAVDVEFVGVRWANWLSAAAWAGTMAGLGWIVVRRMRRHLGSRTRAGLVSPSRSRSAAETGVSTEVEDPGLRSGRPSLRSARGLSTAHTRLGLRWWESVLAAVLLFGVIGAGPTREAIEQATYAPLDCVATSSRPGDDQHPPAHAFDGDDTTFWFVPGGSPATLTVVPRQAEKFRRLTLLARRSGLWEAWHRVRVVMYLRGEVVFEKEYRLANADREPKQEIRFPSTRANRIELHFSDPVTLTRDGTVRADPNAVSPGYREIRLE